eukprot:TRINITY_DN8720_c0_g1_i1.p1 TRINITY_DN8720_c0_g1~~TRINITY_DN8720_c0_g1_i1.p1  ORF type:complete len:595 (-),score=112.36 TRINITY_DN8720_c0_g1_i1:290-2074(-)
MASSFFGDLRQQATNSISPIEEKKEARRQAGPWLPAFHDAMANLHAYSECVRVADLKGDGDYRLLVADSEKKIKVFKGTSFVQEVAVLGTPTSMVVYYADSNKPQVPHIAVAVDQYVYIHKNLKPHYRFSLPNVDVEKAEADIWNKFLKNEYDIQQIIDKLTEARDVGVQLSNRSVHLLSLKEAKEQESWIELNKKFTLTQSSVITCMETVAKTIANDRAVSCIVLGTEHKQIYILDSNGSTIIKTFTLPSVPFIINTMGSLDVEYRIVVACRNGNIYSIKRHKVMGTVIELETQPVAMCLLEKSILVACIDQTIHNFHFKGKTHFSLYLPEPITNMTPINLKRLGPIRSFVVTLKNGEVRLYNRKSLLHTFQLDNICTALRFGPYGREEACLMLCGRSGALTVKMLQRQAKLDAATTLIGPPPEQDQPLNLPKRTKLYVEQTQRERDQAGEMYRIFQRNLCKLRLNTARAYVKVLTDGQGPLSSSNQLRLDARVDGIGPLFKLKLMLRNTSSKVISDIPITFLYNPSLYRLTSTIGRIPILIPGLTYSYEVDVQSIDPQGAAGPIRVFICNPKSVVPTLAAIVNMRESEVLLD